MLWTQSATKGYIRAEHYFILSPSYLFHKSLLHKVRCFLAAGTLVVLYHEIERQLLISCQIEYSIMLCYQKLDITFSAALTMHMIFSVVKGLGKYQWIHYCTLLLFWYFTMMSTLLFFSFKKNSIRLHFYVSHPFVLKHLVWDFQTWIIFFMFLDSCPELIWFFLVLLFFRDLSRIFFFF